MTTRRARAPTAGKTKPLGGPKTKGMGVERQTKVGTHDPLGGPKTKGMGVERQTKVGIHDPPLGGKTPVNARTQVNGYAGDRPPSPWRGSRERQHDREVK